MSINRGVVKQIMVLHAMENDAAMKIKRDEDLHILIWNDLQNILFLREKRMVHNSVS